MEHVAYLSHLPVYIQMVEVVEGYGVTCTKLQLEEALTAGVTPTKLARNLLVIFHTPEQLSQLSACGKRGKFKAIDPTILSTITGTSIH